MVGSPASGGEVLDQYALDLPDDAMTDLAETIVGTYRAVGESGNRVAAIRLCMPDASQAETLRQTVLSAGAQNVEVVAESEAAAAVARSAGADAALLLADDDTVSLTAVGQDLGEGGASTTILASLPIGAAGAAVACAAVLQKVPVGEVHRIMLVGQRLDLDSVAAELHSTAPVEVAPDAGYAIARGAAQTAQESGFPAGAATMMAPAAVDATQMAPATADATQMAPSADPAAVGPLLAYSQEEPGEYELPYESLEEFVPEIEDEEAYTAMIAPPPPKTLLMGSALAFVIAAFATLAVTVAVNIRPVADVQAQPMPAPDQQAQTVPGNFLPAVPHEPDPVALPVAVVSPAPQAPVRQAPINRGPNSVAPQAPAPQAPVPGPGPAPAPVVPVVPGVPIVPFPPFNPFPTIPTYTTTVTTSVTPTTSTTTPTTTTTTPTTTSTTTSTETTTEETTTTTTSVEQPTILYSPASPKPEPPVTQVEPAYSPPAVAPVVPAPAAPVAPVAPVAPAAPAAPEAPSSGSGGYGSGSDSGGAVEAPATTVLESP
jgi:hypothetical protein